MNPHQQNKIDINVRHIVPIPHLPSCANDALLVAKS